MNPRGNLESTPRKKVAGAKAGQPKAQTSTAALPGEEVAAGSLFSLETSTIPQRSCAMEATAPTSPLLLPQKSPARPVLKLPTPPAPAAAVAAVAKIYGIAPGSARKDKETTKKAGPSTADLMRDPFIGVKPGLPTTKTVKAKVQFFRGVSVNFP